MADGLRSYPFCGGEAHCEKSLRIHIGECWRVGCDTKGCVGWILESTLYLSDKMAVDKWNARAERTCECDSTLYWDMGFGDPYYEHELSCGHTIKAFDKEPPDYCPNCGARVIA